MVKLRISMQSVFKKLIILLAVVLAVIFTAVLAGMLLSPVLNKHRPDFEKWGSEFLHVPITIEKVRFSWARYQPEIVFDNVTAFNATSHEPILQVEHIGVSIAILQSIWHRTAIPSGLMLDGSDVDLIQTKTGDITIKGFPSLSGFSGQPYDREMKFQDVMGWLSMQPRLALRNIDVRYTNVLNEKKFFSLYRLKLVNDATSHRITGKAILHQGIPTELKIAIQWEGAVFDLNKLSAKIYLYVSGFSLSQWAKDHVWQGWQVKEGLLSAKVWMTWENGAFQTIQTTSQGYHLKLYSQVDKSTHVIDRLSGNVGWRKEGAGHVIAGDDLLIDLPAHLWPVTNFYIRWMPDAKGNVTPQLINIGYINVADVRGYLPAFPGLLDASTLQWLTQLKPSGGIQNISISGDLADMKNLQLSAKLNRISIVPSQKIPSFSDLSGSLKWDGSVGHFVLMSHRLNIVYNHLFSRPIEIDQLSGDIQWQKNQKAAWEVSTAGLQALNSDVAINVSGKLLLSDKGSTFVDLDSHFTLEQVTHLLRYLPLQVMEPGLVSWLSQAFYAGEIKSGHFLLRGLLKDFPFHHDEGVFSITAIANNIDFRFAPDWPLIRHISANLGYERNTLKIDLERAQTMNMPVVGVHALLTNIATQLPILLTVQDATIETDFTQAMRYVYASPLQTTVGRMFKNVKIAGPLQLTLGLTVPIGRPDTTQAKGVITLHDTTMDAHEWNLSLEKLKGVVNFTEKSVDAEKVEGQLFGRAISFNLATIVQGKSSIIRANFNDKLVIADLEKWLKIPFHDVLKGSADVAGQIDFSGTQSMVLNLQTDLTGIAVDLPDQYAKKANAVRKTNIEMVVPESKPLQLRVTYGDLLAAAVTLKTAHQKYHLLGLNVSFGKGEADWPEGKGLYISGQFDQLDWDKVKSYIDQSQETNFSDLVLQKVDVFIKQLDFFNRRLMQARIQVKPTPNAWNVMLNSPGIVGSMVVPQEWNANTAFTAQFQKLDMASVLQNNKSVSSLLDLKSLPAMSLDLSQVRYNGITLGRIVLKSVSSSAGLTIKSLRIVAPAMQLDATGSCKQSAKGYVTQLQGNAYSPRVSEFLNAAGVDAHNFVSSEGKLDFNLNWNDILFAPSLATLSGHASIKMGKGRIVDLGQGTNAKMDLGRMLSIFSLQTIPRRLSFDFSDIFQKGYSFDSIKGDLTLQNGNINTDNLFFDGPVARVGIRGRIGLQAKDYNFTLIVTPYVTSSIPLAATLLTGQPLVGLAALAVNTVISSQVSKATTYYYAVSGPWNNPTWHSVSVSKGR
ncbi:MAG TPA: YhdP family protein [Gammaproteobacteria bacterium]|jgi:uncharacterized protein (TIGR02099 family)|nr:YhdP family protein [Gammaproteobacteria bacterium]